MKYFTDLEVEVDGRIEGQFILIYGKRYKIIRADSVGYYVKVVDVCE